MMMKRKNLIMVHLQQLSVVADDYDEGSDDAVHDVNLQAIQVW
jgi:hypothetical protein